MNEQEFNSLRPGDVVSVRGTRATVSQWLQEGYMIEFTSGHNLKSSDTHLHTIRIVSRGKVYEAEHEARTMPDMTSFEFTAKGIGPDSRAADLLTERFEELVAEFGGELTSGGHNALTTSEDVTVDLRIEITMPLTGVTTVDGEQIILDHPHFLAYIRSLIDHTGHWGGSFNTYNVESVE